METCTDLWQCFECRRVSTQSCMEAKSNAFISGHGLLYCISTMLCRIWCLKMEVLLCIPRWCMESSLSRDIWSWNSWSFMLYGTYWILVGISAIWMKWRHYCTSHWIFSFFFLNYLISLSRTVIEDDEVYSVAKLLGDLVAYRASGTGHLELLAGLFHFMDYISNPKAFFAWHLRSIIFSGLALLQKLDQASKSSEHFVEAPLEHLQAALAFHKFAEAAYTVLWQSILFFVILTVIYMLNLSKTLQMQGPLLDFGRNPFVFPCAWLHRQGVLTPWTRKRLSI